MGKLARKALLACACAFLLLIAAACYFRMEKERAVNHYVEMTYAQKCSIEYVGSYLPDDTQTYAVRLNDADKPTFLVVLQGKEVIQDTYLLECMSKEIVQNWADDLYNIWGPCRVWLQLTSTQLSKTSLPDTSNILPADMLQYVQSSQQRFYIQPDTMSEETVIEERLVKTREFLASWGASLDVDAVWIETTACTGTSAEPAGFCLDTNGQIQACGGSANLLQIMEVNGLNLPVKP